ncbi:putative endoplasmic reticulum protein [Rosellinia necatrix]|uniref:Putative endoplasmic reticulum protein n=1 Tax=Rosellinia necatrix TaxID=77044 RepID=A0A1W2TUS4_ROSNE|nr:putative endoplasmic reticulum protein [Rosellinia necatrix]
MAPPPSADLPLGERLLALAQTLQFAWFSGHLVLLLCITRYGMSYIFWNWYSGWARFAYRLSFLSAALTYGIVVYKTWRARQKVGAKYPGSVMGILSDENIQYLAMALVWLLAPQIPLALLPYGIYSIFHVATYTRSNVIPTVQPNKGPAGAAGAKQSTPLAEAIGTFVKKYYDTSMSIVAGLEMGLWFRLFLGAVLFQSRSWILLGLYTAFLRARFAQSTHVQDAFNTLELRLNSMIGAQGTSPTVQTIWETVKGGVRQFHAATDLSKYSSGSAVPKKTS